MAEAQVATEATTRKVRYGGGVALTIVAAGWILGSMDYNLYNFALPLILEDLNITIPTAGLIFFLSLQGTFVGSLVVPVIADYVGRIKTMMVNIAIYAGATGATAFAPIAWFLVIARFLVNFGVGAEQPVGAAYISETWDPRTRGRAMGFMQSGWAIGTLLASLLLALVGSRFGWRVLFIVGLLPALLLVIIRFWLPESGLWQEEQARRKERTAAAKAEADEPAEKFTIAQLFEPDLRRYTIIGLIILIVGNAGSGGINAWAATFLKVARGLDIATVGWYGTVIALGMLVGYNSFGWIADSIGRRYTFIAYFILAALATIVFSLVTNLVALAFAAFFVGIFPVGVFAGFVIYLSELFPTRARASGIGLCMGVGLFFWALVPYLMSILAPGGQFSTVFMVVGIIAYSVGVITMFFAPETLGKELT